MDELDGCGKPDVAVLDYSMPECDGAEAATTIGQRFPEVKVVVLTMHDNVHYLLRAMDAGAHGFVLKESASEELLTAIRASRKRG